MADDILLDFLHMEFVSLFDEMNGEEKPNDLSRQESIGYQVGFRFIKKYTREWNRFKDELEIIKFICKEFWSAIFGKQADTLRTNHQGIYVLIDNQFRFLKRMTDSQQYMDQIGKYLAFSCGLIRGALFNLGIPSVVTTDVSQPPSVKFQIKIHT
ncbi:trafficking protein particle complex subunit Trs33 [Dermatophagoides farinae]|uniref:Trafficking protein particle complex subunit 6B n=1 Tax=Dermatophagoides farinae TaxID=6954 RepID=A0A922KYG2_DERFA|nr:trafficking protein particle complex subunit 6b-like [Dermatophagoides farinae]KAH7642961.1 trafficking protein particle complex subunit 6b-like protein [Dermatophagoides farinae]KAH9505945.1 Trafficking protein particle complex subunit 6B [Dermatophagoides farinae]